MIEGEFDTRIFKITLQPVNQLMHSFLGRNCAAHLRFSWPVSLQMSSQFRAAKYQTRTQPIRIAGINSTEGRRQEIVRCRVTKYAPPPLRYRLKRPWMQTQRTLDETEAESNDIREIQRQAPWPPAIDESLASIMARRQERHANVSAH